MHVLKRFSTLAVGLLAAASIALVAAPAASADTFYGGTYNDSLTGTYGNDLLLGYGGNDVLVGSWGDDTIAGHIGNDVLYGSPGNDVINGGDGDDQLIAGFDYVRDTVICGYGIDVAWIRPGDVTYGCERVYWA